MTKQTTFEFPFMQSVIHDAATNTVRPAHLEGDDFYGLSLGSNGTAKTCRRALVEVTLQVNGLSVTAEWRQSNGKPATGLTLVPTNHETWVSPWAGPESEA